MNPDLLQPAQNALDSIRSLPWAAHGIAAAALITGLILWLHGRRLLKPMIVVVFALGGAASGFAVLPLTPIADSVSTQVGLVLGGVVGAVAGLLLFRFAMAISLGLVLAVMAPVMCVAVTDLRAETSASEPLTKEELLLRGVAVESDESISRELARRGEKLRESARDAAARAVDLNAPATDSTTQDRESDDKSGGTTTEQMVRAAAPRVRAFIGSVWEEVRMQWNELPSRVRVMLVGSASLGLGLGVILGLLLPKWTSGGVTAMLGSAIWLPAGVWLLAAAGLSISDRWHPSATQWLVVWAIVAGAGTLIQWRGLHGKKARGTRVIVQQAS